MQCQCLFSGKIRKNINLLSAEFAQSDNINNNNKKKINNTES